MKKIFKISALILAVVVMCLSFSGCAELDDMREAHATWTEEGNTESINYNGEVYKLLEDTGSIYPAFANSSRCDVYVTEPDVPVLLSQDLSVNLQLSNDKNFIYGYMYDAYDFEYNTSSPLFFAKEYYGGAGREVLYCKESIYDEVSKNIADGVEFTTYGYEYWTFNEETLEEEPICYTLTEEEAKLIDKVLEQKPEEMVNSSDYFIASIEKISDDGYFATYGFDVYINNKGNYELSKYSDALDLYYIYEVPSDLKDEFGKIFKGAEDALKSSMQYIDAEY